MNSIIQYINITLSRDIKRFFSDKKNLETLLKIAGKNSIRNKIVDIIFFPESD